MVPVAMAWSFSGGVALRCVLPVLWMTSRFLQWTLWHRQRKYDVSSKWLTRGRQWTGGRVWYLWMPCFKVVVKSTHVSWNCFNVANLSCRLIRGMCICWIRCRWKERHARPRPKFRSFGFYRSRQKSRCHQYVPLGTNSQVNITSSFISA